MKLLNEGAIELNDNEVFNNCSYSCYMNIADSLNKLKEYEDIGLTPEEIKYFLKDFGVRLVKENRELKKQYKEDKRICIACSGSGWYDNCDKQGNPILCGACDGTGYKD